jgi:hypothetical protein
MTEKEYINRKESLERDQRKLDKSFHALDMEYLKSLNDEYAHFLKKKVVITYEEFGYDRYGNRPQKTITCYWNGFRRDKDGYFMKYPGNFIPMFRCIKRDGTMSSKSISTEFIYKIISMVEAE